MGPQQGRPASLITTGQIAGTLHARAAIHPWLERATELLWTRIQELATPDAYEMCGVLRFLDHVPDRARAEAAFERVGPLLFDRELVVLDPDAPGEVHTPLDFAPAPTWLARQLFDAAFPWREVGTALGLFGTVVGLAFVAGPLAGGRSFLLGWDVSGSSRSSVRASPPCYPPTRSSG